MDDIKFMTGFNVEPVVASESAIAEAISRFYGGGASSHEELSKVMKDLVDEDQELELAAEEAGDGRRRAGKGRRRSAHHQAGEPDS